MPSLSAVKFGQHAVAQDGRARAPARPPPMAAKRPLQDGAGLGREHQVLAGARGPAPQDTFLRTDSGGARLLRAGVRAPAPPRSAPRGPAPAPGGPAPGARGSARARAPCVSCGGVAAGGALDDLHLLLGGGVAHVHQEHEAVELRLGQRVGALLLDGVLGGEDQERQVQRVGAAAGGDAVLLHRLQQRGLRLRRGAVHLVGEDDVGEERALRRSGTRGARWRGPPRGCRCR